MYTKKYTTPKIYFQRASTEEPSRAQPLAGTNTLV
jgi:hypothetical protein